MKILVEDINFSAMCVEYSKAVRRFIRKYDLQDNDYLDIEFFLCSLDETFKIDNSTHYIKYHIFDKIVVNENTLKYDYITKVLNHLKLVENFYHLKKSNDELRLKISLHQFEIRTLKAGFKSVTEYKKIKNKHISKFKKDLKKRIKETKSEYVFIERKYSYHRGRYKFQGIDYGISQTKTRHKECYYFDNINTMCDYIAENFCDTSPETLKHFYIKN